MRSFTSIPGRRINNDAVDQSLISMNLGFRVLGTDSGTSDAINGPVFQEPFLFPVNSHARHHGLCDRASYSVMLGILLRIISPLSP